MDGYYYFLSAWIKKKRLSIVLLILLFWICIVYSIVYTIVLYSSANAEIVTVTLISGNLECGDYTVTLHYH